MSTAEVKELFYNATNAKIVYGHDEGFAEETLRQAVTLSSTLTDQIWPFITAYRLAHLLFRKAKLQSDFEEILKLVERAEASSSRYISIHSKFLKFTALNRLRMLGILGLSERQKICLDEIITGIGDLQRVSNSTDYFNKPVQGEFFNILEYLLYNSEGDFKYPEGIGYDENNILFPRRTNDAWRLIGPAGPLDEFTYNAEIGKLELERFVSEHSAMGWFILGGDQDGIFKDTSTKPEKLPQKIRLLLKIINSGPSGVRASELADLWGVSEGDPESSARKARQDIVNYFGIRDLFFKTSQGGAGTSWAIDRNIKIYGLVNIKELG